MAGSNGTKQKSLFTPTQQRMLKVLADGMPHDRDELFKCMRDELQEKKNIQPFMSVIRRVLRSHGQDIILELFDGLPHYRWIVLLSECRCKKVFGL